MNTEVIHAPINTSMLSLFELMSRHHSTYVVIVDRGQEESENEQQANLAPLFIPVGLITERDIFKFQMQGLNLELTQAQSCMNTTLACISPDEVLWKAYQQMRQWQERQLLVIGDRGELLGIVTDTAILQALDPAEAYEVTITLQQAVVKQSEILFREKELAEVTLKSMSDAVITTDSLGQVNYLNPAAEQLTGWQSDQVKGSIFSEVFKIVNEVTGKPIKNLVEKVLHSGHSFKCSNQTLLVALDGTEYAIDHSATPIHNREGEIIGVVLLFHDVTESRNLANKLSWQATHDTLTGIFNRREFERQVIEAIDVARKKNQQHTLCYIDLDQFKVVNDICGHLAGDRLLCQLTAILKKQIRSTDTLARLGGDEFGLLLDRCPLEKGTQVAEILRKLIQDFHFIWQDKTFSVSASIGLVTIDGNTQDLT
ncbi:MAG: diguanylate cyclase, partial [Prochloraceae cyanobacterium]